MVAAIPEKIKILYIEDDADSSVITRQYLKEATISEFTVVHMCTLKEGLEYLEQECKLEEDCEIDVILLDLILPNSHGIATYKAVVDKCPFIPVVIISGHQEMAIECVRMGAQDYLFKPDYNGGTLTRSLTYAVQRDYITKKYERERDVSKLYLDVAGVMLLLLDVDQTVAMVNRKGCEILGYEESEIVGKNWFDNFVPERIREDVKEIFNQVIAGNVSAVEFYANPIITKDGSEKYISWHNSTITNGGDVITKILSSGEDITEKMIAEDALRKSEAKVRNLVEVTGAGIYEIDLVEGKFTYVNDTMCQQTGYTKEELLELGPSGILTEESIVTWGERWENFKKGKEYPGPFEYSIKTKDGRILYALIVAEFVKNEFDDIVSANVVAIDITKQKMAEVDLKRKEEMIF